MNEKEQILQEIRRVANELAPKSLTMRLFSTAATISVSKLRYHFGSFNEAVLAAGFAPNEGRLEPYQRLDDEELFFGNWKGLETERQTPDGKCL